MRKEKQEQLERSYQETRGRTLRICEALETEDFGAQPMEEVSPPKWHLGHTTWFFETFILRQEFGKSFYHKSYQFLFNSYYNALGSRVSRRKRGTLTRPTVNEILAYRTAIDNEVIGLLGTNQFSETQLNLLELGINHEQQHQELLITDIKYILGSNPLLTCYNGSVQESFTQLPLDWITVKGGTFQIGYQGEGFFYDNERGVHSVIIEPFEIATSLVTNREWLAFVNDGGYSDFEHWHDDGFNWIKSEDVNAPLYWIKENGDWMLYTLEGLVPLPLNEPVRHISWYEAYAFATWSGHRLPTEFEWEAAADLIKWGDLWEWTGSAYLPYPRYQKLAGNAGEYNGKFMINQMVLRGCSFATAPNHSRSSYRNFFNPQHQWQFTGLRLVRNSGK